MKAIAKVIDILDNNGIFAAYVEKYRLKELKRVAEEIDAVYPSFADVDNIDEIITVLCELVDLKDYKDEKGKDEFYLKEQPLLWERAHKVVRQYLDKGWVSLKDSKLFNPLQSEDELKNGTLSPNKEELIGNGYQKIEDELDAIQLEKNIKEAINKQLPREDELMMKVRELKFDFVRIQNYQLAALMRDVEILYLEKIEKSKPSPYYVKGKIVERNEVYYFKWSEFHSFSHGTEYIETEIVDNDTKDHMVNDIVEAYIKTIGYEGFVPINVAVLKPWAQY